jgi:hypothetical protein
MADNPCSLERNLPKAFRVDLMRTRSLRPSGNVSL